MSEPARRRAQFRYLNMMNLPDASIISIAYLRRVLPTSQLAPIASAAESLLSDPNPIDLDGWLAGCDETANRAGLLVCGDVVAAAREIVKEARVRKSGPDGAILDMVRWSCASDCFDLRSQLGLALVSDEDQTPVVAPNYPAI